MIRALLASPLGLLVGFVMGALGSGGSVLAVPALVYAAGESPQEATATSLFLVCVASLSGLPPHWRANRVRMLPGLAIGVTGIAGSVAGSRLSVHMSPSLLMLMFSVLILIAAWRMLTACPSCTRRGEAEALDEGRAPAASGPVLDVRRGLGLVAGGSAVGFLTGLFGVGGGFVVVPMLTLLFGFAMPQAIGTSLLVVAINSVSALLARIGATSIPWAPAIAFSVMAVVGARAGASLAGHVDSERSLHAFSLALVLLSAFTAWSALRAMT